MLGLLAAGRPSEGLVERGQCPQGTGLSCSQAARAMRKAVLNAAEAAFGILRKAGERASSDTWDPRVETVCTRDGEKNVL